MFWSLLLLFVIGAVAIAAIIVSVFSLNSDKSITTSGNLTIGGDVIASNVTSSNSQDISRIGENTKNITSSGINTVFSGDITTSGKVIASNVSATNKQDVETALGRTQYMNSGSGITNFTGEISAVNLSGNNSGDQNIFSSVNVSGQQSVVPTSTSTALNLVAGSGITLATNNSTKSVTISSTGGGVSGPNWTTTSETFFNPARLDYSQISLFNVSDYIPNFFQFIGSDGIYHVFGPTVVNSISPIKLWVFTIINEIIEFFGDYTLTGDLPTNCYGVVGEVVRNTLVIGVSGDDRSNVFSLNFENGVISNQTSILQRTGTSYVSGLRLKQVYSDDDTETRFALCTWTEQASSGTIRGCQFYWVNLNTNSFTLISSPVIPGISSNYSDTKIKLSTKQIIVSTGNQTINFFDYVVDFSNPFNPPIITEGQIITLPDNTPQYLNPNIIFDQYNEDAPKTFDVIHVCFPGYDNTDRRGGFFITYRYNAGTWNQIRTWSLSEYYSVADNSYWGGYVYNGGYYNPTTNNNYGYAYDNTVFLASPSTCGIAQIKVTPIAAFPFLEFQTIPNGIFYPLGAPFTGVNNFNIYPVSKGITGQGYRQISTTYQSPNRIMLIDIILQSGTTIQWQTTGDNIKETAKLAVADGGIFKIPVTPITNIVSQYPVLINGYTFIDPITSELKVYYNGVFKTVNWI